MFGAGIGGIQPSFKPLKKSHSINAPPLYYNEYKQTFFCFVFVSLMTGCVMDGWKRKEEGREKQ